MTEEEQQRLLNVVEKQAEILGHLTHRANKLLDFSVGLLELLTLHTNLPRQELQKLVERLKQ